ncbi:MAG: hypothetical protein JXA94_01250 [Parachlamydiales bacterium]|nr:hypothetical protein [Parachlamydiales bacterium]
MKVADLENITQSAKFIDENMFYPMYSSLNTLSKKTSAIRIITPIVMLSDSIISLAQTISFFFECIIKGSTNLFGIFVSNHCNPLRGVLQLTIGPLATAITFIPIIVIRTIRVGILFFLNPIKFTENELSKLLEKKQLDLKKT